MNKAYISVSGFSASGSSAVIDYLKEFSNIFECSAEIRFIQDPYGISQLERAITTDWNDVASSAAARDYLWLCKICNRNGGGKNPFARCGLSYGKKINKNFYRYSREYILSLSDFTYKSDYYCQKFKKNYLKYVSDRIRLGIELSSKRKIKIANRKMEDSYFIHPSQERFEEETKKYMDKIFEKHFTDTVDYVLLDQAISVNNPDGINKYFNNGKLIIVDRDPRDMYIDDIVNWGAVFGKFGSLEDAKRYVCNHKAMREKIKHDKNVLLVRFEELVLDYDKVTEKIRNFLDLDNSKHIYPNKYFDPSISKKNIGLWKKHYEEFKDAIDYIGENLKDYCFE